MAPSTSMLDRASLPACTYSPPHTPRRCVASGSRLHKHKPDAAEHNRTQRRGKEGVDGEGGDESCNLCHDRQKRQHEGDGEEQQPCGCKRTWVVCASCLCLQVLLLLLLLLFTLWCRVLLLRRVRCNSGWRSNGRVLMDHNTPRCLQCTKLLRNTRRYATALELAKHSSSLAQVQLQILAQLAL